MSDKIKLNDFNSSATSGGTGNARSRSTTSTPVQIKAEGSDDIGALLMTSSDFDCSESQSSESCSEQNSNNGDIRGDGKRGRDSMALKRLSEESNSGGSKLR